MTAAEIAQQTINWKYHIERSYAYQYGLTFIYKSHLPRSCFWVMQEAVVDPIDLFIIGNRTSPPDYPANLTIRKCFKEIYILDYEGPNQTGHYDSAIISYVTRADVKSGEFDGPYPGTIDMTKIPITKYAIPTFSYDDPTRTILSLEELFFYKDILTERL